MAPSPPKLPLSTLPVFRAAARLQNLRGVAAEMHLTHSAVSQQIKQLEQQIGMSLFDRRGRGLVLNAAGEALQGAVEAALQRLAEGLRAAQDAAAGRAHQLRLTVLPSFAQRWLLPRLKRWQARHPEITLEVHSSQEVVNLQREGFHAALRAGAGPWRGLVAERLMDSALIAVAAPQRAAALPWNDLEAIAAEPLLGDNGQWERFLALGGCRLKSRAVAEFNDAGLMLQAAEQDLGIALAREGLVADALHSGRLVRLAAAALEEPGTNSFWLVYPPELGGWPPLEALRRWLHEEMAGSRAQAQLAAGPPP